jgi:hypothetical protein
MSAMGRERTVAYGWEADGPVLITQASLHDLNVLKADAVRS